MIFFRGQDQLTDTEQEAFGRLLGDLVPHPTVPSLAGTKAVLDIDGGRGERASSWHTDVTFVDAYPKISILRGAVVPASGGDTVWANMVAAYEELPAPLRTLADQLWALHSNVYDYVGDRQAVHTEGLKRYQEVFTRTVYETEHPVVHVHPETGERSLILGHFLQRILGFSSSELGAPLRHPPGPRHPDREHGPLALAGGRRRDLGQPRHPAPGRGRLWRPAAGRPARDHRRRGAGQRRRPAQRHPAQGAAARGSGLKPRRQAEGGAMTLEGQLENPGRGEALPGQRGNADRP